MPQEIANNSNSAMLREVAQVNARAQATARGENTEQTEELPEGTSPVETQSAAPVAQAQTPEEAPEETQGESSSPAPVAAAEAEEPVRVGEKTYRNYEEAFRELERERELEAAHSAGIREALEVTRAQNQPTQPEPEDDFEQRFYANPKETLKEVQAKARDEALAALKAEQQKEKLWSDFLSEFPDIRRKDAERVLAENMDTIGKLTDVERGKKLLAQKVRAEYDEILSQHKPRTQLASKPQAISPSGGTPRGVTPTKKEETPLSFSEQMRKLRGL